MEIQECVTEDFANSIAQLIENEMYRTVRQAVEEGSIAMYPSGPIGEITFTVHDFEYTDESGIGQTPEKTINLLELVKLWAEYINDYGNDDKGKQKKHECLKLLENCAIEFKRITDTDE